MRLLCLAFLAACSSTEHSTVDAPEGSTADASAPGTEISVWAIGVQPQTVTLSAPGSMDVTVMASRMLEHGGTPHEITLSVSQVPSGVTATFGSNAIAADASTATLTVSVTGALPTATIEVIGSGWEQHGEAAGDTTHSATFSVTAN